MKHVLYLVVSFLLTSTAYGDWIRLASWNIEHLGRNADESTVPKALAEHIFLTGADIMVFQEIYDNDNTNATRTNTQLTAAFEHLEQRTGDVWQYEMLPNRRDEDDRQLIVVSWNTQRVEKVGDALRLNIQRQGNEWHRHPHAIKFSAGREESDIVVIPVHMKADYRGDFSEQRNIEAQALIEQLPAIRQHFDDTDIVILGDLNCGEASEPAMAAFAGAGFRDLNANDTATHVRYGPLDRILVYGSRDSEAHREFSFTRQYVITAADSDVFDHYLSDHQVITAPIRVIADDD